MMILVNRKIKILSILFISLLISISCRIKSDENIGNSSKLIQASIDKIDRINPAFYGVWIDKSYYDFLLSSKSPYLTQKSHPYTIIYINESSEVENRVKLYEYKYGQTEISSMQYYSHQDNQLFFSFETFDGILIGDTCRNDCKRIFLEISDRSTLLRKFENNSTKDYIKIDSRCIGNSFDCEVTKLITTHFLKGSYMVLDHKKEVLMNEINIDENGFIKGQTKFHRMILLNFFREINGAYEFDVLELSSRNAVQQEEIQPDKIKRFKLERSIDTLILRNTFFDEDNFEVTVGEIEYYLVKK